MKPTGMMIDWETADGITRTNLLDHYNYLVKEVEEYENEGQWMHEEDYKNSKENLIPSLRIVLGYYGVAV